MTRKRGRYTKSKSANERYLVQGKCKALDRLLNDAEFVPFQQAFYYQVYNNNLKKTG